MNEKELKDKLLSDLTMIGLPADEVELKIRPYSKSFYGRYYPSDDRRVKPKIHVYPYNSDGSLMNYNSIFSHCVVHEFCHHVQYSDGSWVRRKGVMHDVQFWKLYNHYMHRAVRYHIVEGGEYLEKTV